MVRLQKGPMIGAGRSVSNHFHIHNMGDDYVLLVDAAITGQTDDMMWGPKAYYVTENGEPRRDELAQATAEAATKLGYLPKAKTETLDSENVKEYAGYESAN